MGKVINSMIVERLPWSANFTEKNHLGAAMLLKPQVIEPIATKLFTAQRYADNPLTAMVNKTGSKKVIDTTEWEWQLRGTSTRPLVIVENVESGNSTPGKYNTIFKIKLDEDWYLPGDVLQPGNPDYQIRIQSIVGRQGNGVVYEVRLMNDDSSAFLPVKYLAVGTKWAKVFAQYGEASKQDGSTQFSMPLTLKNRMSRFRKKYEITGDAANEVLAVMMTDSNGGKHGYWVKYAEVEYWEQWYRELERAAWYSKPTNTVLDENGRPIYSGPGVQEQLKESHVNYYSHLSASLIEDYLMDIFYGRVKPGSGRNIKAFTGEYGMLIFHRAIQDWMEKKGFVQNVEVFTNKVGSEYSANALAGGYQFVKYHMANGSSLELVHNPLYDDREINFEIDPVTGYPIESMRFTFMDFSNGGAGNTNISWYDKKDGFALGYVAGLQGPYGPTQNTLMAHSGNYYSMHVEKQFGIHIEDPTKCGELILKRS